MSDEWTNNRLTEQQELEFMLLFYRNINTFLKTFFQDIQTA